MPQWLVVLGLVQAKGLLRCVSAQSRCSLNVQLLVWLCTVHQLHSLPPSACNLHPIGLLIHLVVVYISNVVHASPSNLMDFVVGTSYHDGHAGQ